MVKNIVTYLLCILLAVSVCAQPGRNVRTLTNNLLIDGVTLISEGQYETSRGVFEALLKEDPENDALHYYLAVCEMRSGKAADAEKHIQKAIQLDSTNLWYSETLASLYSTGGRMDKATDILARLMEKDPKQFATPFTLTMLADRELSAAKDSTALDYIERALEIEPSYPPALIGKAEVYRMRGNYPMYFVALNEFVGHENIYPEAKADYLDNLLQNFNPRMYRVWGSQLDSLVDLGVRVSQRDTSMLSLAGRWYYGTGRRDKGVAYFNSLLEADPKSYDANMIHIQLLGEDKKYDEMIEVCTALLGFCEPERRAQVFSILGDTYYLKEDRKSAYKAYDSALKENPEYIPVLNNYAYYLSLEGRKLRKALKMSAKTIEKEPENPTYLDTYAWILHLLRKDESAKIYLKKAIVYGGNSSATVLQHYAEVLRALGEEDLARHYESQAERKAK